MDEDLNYDVEEELVAVIPTQQNWKGIGISLVVILSVIGMVAFAVFLMTPTDHGPRIRGRRISLNNFTSGIFTPNKFNATWVSDTQVAFISVFGSLDLLDVITLKRRELVSSNVFRTLGGSEFSLSPDLAWVMVRHHEERKMETDVPRAMFSLQQISRGPSSPLLKLGVKRSRTGWEDQELLQAAVWVPEPPPSESSPSDTISSSNSSGILLVANNNIFYKPSTQSQEMKQITEDGEQGVIFNGVTNWLYRERILHSSSAIWVSPGGDWVAFAKFNDSRINLTSMPDLDTGAHSGSHSFRYPKSEGEIPVVTLFVYNLRTSEIFEIKPPEQIANRSHYLVHVSWVGNDSLFSAWLNRRQDLAIHSLYSAPDFNIKQVNSVTSSSYDTESFLWDNLHSPLISEDQTSLISLLPLQQRNRGLVPGLVHKKLQAQQGKEEQVSVPLSQDGLEVQEIISWDESSDSVYFMASLLDVMGSLHLLRTSSEVTNSSEQGEAECITCHLPGPPCSFNRVHMAPNHSAFIQECLGPGVPFSRVIDLQSKKVIFILDTNVRLTQTLDKFSLPKVKDLTLDLNKLSFSGRVRLFMPSGFREDEEFAFPLLIYMMDSSWDQAVSLRWDVGWHTYLASSRDFIVVMLDLETKQRGNRGAKLGGDQVEYALEVLRYLVTGKKYVDTSKIGLVGSGYGGFIAGSILAADAKSDTSMIKSSILVTPIVNWRKYDVFFSEQQIGPVREQKYWSQYDAANLVLEAANVPSKVLYLVHQPGDLANLEQTMSFSRALVDKGVLFKQQIYLEVQEDLPAKIHMYKSMESHFDDCFGPIEDFFKDDYFLASLAELS